MKKFDQINVIPFIDIMLVLLAIVLMTATFVSQGQIQVNLPKSQTATNTQKTMTEARRITITYDAKYYLDDELTTLAAIAETALNWSDSQRIILKIDSDTSFNEFIQIGDIFRQNNLDNITIQTIIGND